MKKAILKNKIVALSSLIALSLIISSNFANTNYIFAAGKFSIEAKIDLERLSLPDKVKVVASANGETATKYLEGKDLKATSKSATFEFNEKNDIVSVGSRDEFFVCAYAMDSATNQMQSYSCVEGNIEHPDGINKIEIGSGPKRTLSSGSFQTVSGGEIKSPTINVHIPLSDRKDVKHIKVITMIKGEFQSSIIDVQDLLRTSKDNTLILPLAYDKTPELGPIREGDMFYACVSANELNPPEGTECEHRITSHMYHVHNIVAR
jgi:hypothetical protein